MGGTPLISLNSPSYNFIDTDSNLIKNNDSKRLNGNKTLMINIGTRDRTVPDNEEIL